MDVPQPRSSVNQNEREQDRQVQQRLNHYARSDQQAISAECSPPIARCAIGDSGSRQTDVSESEMLNKLGSHRAQVAAQLNLKLKTLRAAMKVDSGPKMITCIWTTRQRQHRCSLCCSTKVCDRRSSQSKKGSVKLLTKRDFHVRVLLLRHCTSRDIRVI